MGNVISLFDNPDFDYPYGACTECDGTEWAILLSPEDTKMGVIGFQCLNLDCAVVAIFEESKEIVFELEK